MRKLTAADVLSDLAQSPYVWDEDSGRYRNRNSNRPVLDRTVQRAGERYIEEHVRSELEQLGDRLIAGDISLERWQTETARVLKDAHLIVYTTGRGGAEQMGPSDWGRIGGRLRYQYQRLDLFARQILSGRIRDDGTIMPLSEGEIRARIRMYARSVRTAFFDGRTAAKETAGYQFEQRILGSGEACPDCVDYANRGIVPIGSLPEPGKSSVCRSNCQCSKIYFRADDLETALEMPIAAGILTRSQ